MAVSYALAGSFRGNLDEKLFAYSQNFEVEKRFLRKIYRLFDSDAPSFIMVSSHAFVWHKAAFVICAYEDKITDGIINNFKDLGIGLTLPEVRTEAIDYIVSLREDVEKEFLRRVHAQLL